MAGGLLFHLYDCIVHPAIWESAPEMTPYNIGIIGCGAISNAYFTACKRFSFLKVAGAADLDLERAKAKCAEHGVGTAMTVEQLLADPGIQVVINLTIPKVHAEIDLKILNAGKHVFSEKPFALTRAEGEAVVALAKQKKLRVGCAPDTVLGCGVQTCRKYLDDGLVGTVIGGSAFMLCGGHEHWHPSPEFYYQHGGGPMFDMGPYYLHALITLLGPVKRVSGATRTTWAERTIASQPKKGQVMKVEIPTHVVSLLEFVQGAVITLTTSFDVKGQHTMPNIELYGTNGSMQVPDPNNTSGPIRMTRRGMHDWTEYHRTHPYKEGSRGVGVADMVQAIISGRKHRANDEIAMHALDIMQAVHEAGASGKSVDLTTTCERPVAMRNDLAEWVALDP
jgi:predicted dehydrogenase